MALALAACGGGGGGGGGDGGYGGGGDPDAGDAPGATVAVFAPPQPGSTAAWGSLPFPSDLFLDGDGRLAPATLPSGPGADQRANVMLSEALATVDGVGVWTNVYFPVDGSIDPASLAGNIAIVDLEDMSPVEANLIYRDDLQVVIASPRLGVAYRDAHRYGAYMTTGVTDAGGAPIAASAAFAAASDLGGAASDPAIAAAREHLRPLLEALPDGVELASATVFRTQDVTTDTLAMRAIAAAATPLLDVTEGLAVHGPDEAELDALFGDAAPGATAGHGHYRGLPQPHDSVAAVIHATIGIPSFLSDSFATDGILEYDGDGVPIVKSTQPARLTLVLPEAVSYQELPVVVWVHGINRTRADMLAIAEPAAQRGFAVVAIDLLHHGDRRQNAVDEKNDTTREPACASGGGGCVPTPDVCSCPDGFADQVELLPATNFFHLLPSGGIDAYHPLAMRENLRQSAIDLVSLAAFLRDGDFSAIEAELGAAGLPDELSFRGDEIGIVTESFGSMLSLIAMAVEPSFDIAILASPASSFPYPTLIHSPNFSPNFTTIILSPSDVEDRTQLGDPIYGGRTEPILDLWNVVMQTGDPVAYARYALSGELRGDAGANVIFAQSWSDEWVPNDAVEHLVGSLNLPVLTPALDMEPPDARFRYVSLPVEAGPIEGNVSNGQRTAVHTLWYPAAHALVRKIEDASVFEPGFPPFTRLETPWSFDSPVARVQQMWGDFFTDFFEGDLTPEVAAP